MTCGICLAIKQRIIGTLLVLDEEGNVLWGKSKLTKAAGNAHETCSDRLYWMRLRGSKFAKYFCIVLTAIQNGLAFLKICKPTKDHCKQAIKDVPEVIATDG